MPKFQTNSEEFLSEILTVIKDVSMKFNNQNIKLVDEFSKDAGVWERYTLKEHVLLVLNQFSKYDIFDGVTLPSNIDSNVFRAMLVFHDLGKPYAISLGDKRLQGSYNKIFLEKVQPKISSKNVELFAELVSVDILGGYVKQQQNLENTFSLIVQHAKNCGVSVREYYILLKIYYMCDAGSYTADSGGQKSLDFQFKFDHKNRTISFSDKVAPRIQQLDKIILQK